MPDATVAINKTLDNEGGEYVADDNGRGPSRWGITLLTAQHYQSWWTADMIDNLSRSSAFQFYQTFIWPESRCSRIEDQLMCEKVYDLYVNMGPRAIGILQAVVGVTQDNILGPMTAAAVNERDPEQLLIDYRTEVAQHYQDIAAANPKLAPDLPGWLSRLEKA